MHFNDAVVNGFLDELDSMKKEAGIGLALKALGKGLRGGFGAATRTMGKGVGARGVSKGMWSSAKAGGSRVLKAFKNPRGVQWRAVGSGLGQMAPMAGAVGAGGLATYGAGKMAFGD